MIVKEEHLLTWQETAQQLYTINQQYKQLALQKEQLTSKLKLLSGNKTTLIGGYLFEESIRKGSINYAQIPELLSVDLETYRKPDVSCWELKKIV